MSRHLEIPSLPDVTLDQVGQTIVGMTFDKIALSNKPLEKPTRGSIITFDPYISFEVIFKFRSPTIMREESFRMSLSTKLT